jgi:hypothetical protein
MAVAEHRIRSARQNGRDEAALEREQWVTDGVDTSMNAVKTARIQPSLDGRSREAELEQLAVGDDAVLAPGQSGQLLVT